MPKVEIRIRGHLDPGWSERLSGLEIGHTSNGTTVLAGSVRDQSALQGLIATLGILNLDLMSVTVGNSCAERQDGGEDMR